MKLESMIEELFEVKTTQDAIFIGGKEVSKQEAFIIGQKLLDIANGIFNYALDSRDIR